MRLSLRDADALVASFDLNCRAVDLHHMVVVVFVHLALREVNTDNIGKIVDLLGGKQFPGRKRDLPLSQLHQGRTEWRLISTGLSLDTGQEYRFGQS
ncbi:hypothetical protein PG995_000333 [Apiospora arundinis]